MMAVIFDVTDVANKFLLDLNVHRWRRTKFKSLLAASLIHKI